jgi:small subunit ribosomal protein S9
MATSTFTHGLGRRKTAVARVRIRPGTGTILINGRELHQYFPGEQWAASAIRPLVITDRQSHFDVFVNANGGGKTGQAEAVALGIARALNALDTNTFMKPLRDAGQLTRDSREVERKKYGQSGARRAFQFSKR